MIDSLTVLLVLIGVATLLMSVVSILLNVLLVRLTVILVRLTRTIAYDSNQRIMERYKASQELIAE